MLQTSPASISHLLAGRLTQLSISALINFAAHVGLLIEVSVSAPSFHRPASNSKPSAESNIQEE
ncbi:hypothetical protein [Acidisarcina polymorpha]|uniref:hypothetical protein n=1 Tax=Acidisarcina polymorpha TaxID=2211140 RepID=UPI000DEF2154